jgi:hypothetical protein
MARIKRVNSRSVKEEKQPPVYQFLVAYVSVTNNVSSSDYVASDVSTTGEQSTGLHVKRCSLGLV